MHERKGERRHGERKYSDSRRSLDHEPHDWRRSSVERIECKESWRKTAAKSMEKPRERDDWRSLERARKDEGGGR